MSVFSFNDFKSLEEAREALITDYDRQRAELRQRSMAIKRELLRKTGQAKALRALRKHTKEVTRRLKKDLKEKLAAADLWAFEDPDYPAAASGSRPAEKEVTDASNDDVEIEAKPQSPNNYTVTDSS
ncbi:hypothetical protein A1Q1_07797 [Trichosporon asahii var. asahii CBS 2479]|uniref:Uncharacterized protein n=1 Tax=Trichosporon asahii var. asahii (strain ATCC 90039 / CBS 2479 / JCM 2466 / KCTC 7840 / NBRC 103889/ NCYC 2677 / UAMH 7654) TaxID=1186058 RepID=J5R6Y9_TRIAS|nr:hypothetical protein A1Q1_07797 [Trichosporon asahii var. asahii CBS 2479]EJT51003.1 hypothetical protein A1Q1_07797 [Trichosporon asahii var. asahii CBS 2479]